MSGEQVLRVFAVRRWWIVAGILIGVIIGTSLALLLPRVYDSSAQVIVSISDEADVGAAESAAYVDDRIPTVLEIAGSNDFAAAVSRAQGIDRSPSEIRSSLKFTLVPDTSVIEVSAEDSDPDQATQLANEAAAVMSRPALTKQLGTDGAMEISMLQAADNGGGAVFPDPLRFIGIGTLAGLVLGLIVALVRQGLDSRVRDLEDISHILGARLLAVRHSKPSRAVRRQIALYGAATTITGLLARLGLISRHRETLYLALCGVEGAGNELTADIIETAAANSMRCLLVSADPAALLTAHYRELSAVKGVDVVDSNAESGGGIISGTELAAVLPRPVDDYDLVVFLGSDLVAHPEACAYLDDAELAVVVTVPQPDRSELQATCELIRTNGTEITGYVLVDPTPQQSEPCSADTAVQNWYQATPRHGTESAAQKAFVTSSSADSKNEDGGQS